MYLGNLQHQTPPSWFPPVLRNLIEFMTRTDFREVPDGILELPGIPQSDAYCSVQRYPSRPVQDCEPEAHRRFADVHLVVQGEEAIGWAPRRPGLAVQTPYQSDADIEIFAEAPGERMIQLQPGDYLLADVDDVHRPRCVVGASTPVLKVVGKIRSALLQG